MRKSGASLESMPELIARWVGHLGFTVEAKFAPSGDEEAFPNRVALSGPDASHLAANRGVALDALQFLVHEAQGEREDSKLAYLDVKGARLFRMQEVMAMGLYAAEKAREPQAAAPVPPPPPSPAAGGAAPGAGAVKK